MAPIGVFDRHRRIEPGRAVDIDIIGAEAAQRVGDKVLHRRGPAVDATERAGRIAQRAELHRDDDAVARCALERPADQHLVVTHAVEVAGIDQRDPGVHRCADRGDAFGFVRRPISAWRHSHAAKAQNADRRSGPAEFHRFHDFPQIVRVFTDRDFSSAAQDSASRRRHPPERHRKSARAHRRGAGPKARRYSP